jgi:hypothetical protein
MNETLKKLQVLIKLFNDTFELEPAVEGELVNALKLKSLKNDGEQFMDELFDVFSNIVKSCSNEYELIYTAEKGLAIAKKIVTYQIED